MIDIVITLNKKIDRSTINADTTINYVNNYAPEGDNEIDYKYSDLSTDEKEALNVLLDKLSFATETDALVFLIERDGKDFDLSNSYVRDAQSTVGPLTAMPDGSSLIMRVEVPGFSSNVVREVSVFYNEAFLTPDLDALAEIGVSITGTGERFLIDNDRECRISFLKPEIVSDFYIITDVDASLIIEP